MARDAVQTGKARLLRLVLLALVLDAQAAAAQSQAFIADSAIHKILKHRVEAKRAAGIVVGTLDANGRSSIVAFGPADAGGTRPIDANSVFEIGSITKTFTATILADMVMRGEVKLDDPVAKYLPSDVHVPSRGGKQITLVDLSTQSSGLPRMPANFHPTDANNPYADYSVRQMYDFLSAYELTRDIGSRYEYSNLGVGLLGHALALRAGMSYEALVTARVLGPLGMTDTRITLTPSQRSRLAVGHDNALRLVANWDLPTFAGAGALRSTTADMLKYLAANLDSTHGPLAKAIAFTHVSRHATDDPNLSIGLNWHILRRDGTQIVLHNGGTGGYHSFIGFDPARRVGVVVLANSSASIDDIALHLLDPRSPLAQAPAAPKPRVEIALDPAMLDRYVGDYELVPSFHIVITREGAALFAQATDQPKFQLFAESETNFFLKVVDAQVTFVKDAGGAATTLVLHQNGQDMAGKKKP
ncbi:MAG TPA: serine hydrolase [Gemmatimonadaceae bacterium]|nr:serine hydrolase [Gemmatimonadaceae bacterium]